MVHVNQAGTQKKIRYTSDRYLNMRPYSRGLGSGTFGTVWLVRDTWECRDCGKDSTRALYAAKVAKASASATDLKDVKNECAYMQEIHKKKALDPVGSSHVNQCYGA